MDWEGTNPTNLTSDEALDERPDWQPLRGRQQAGGGSDDRGAGDRVDGSRTPQHASLPIRR